MWAAGFVAALTTLWKSPLGVPVRVGWERLVAGPRRERRTAEIAAAVKPLTDEIKAAARNQHDAQNALLAEHGARLDRGAEVMTEMRADIARINGRLDEHRPPSTRTRKDDPK